MKPLARLTCTGLRFEPLPRWGAPVRAWPGVAFPLWHVPVQLHGFAAPPAARAAGGTIPGHEDKVAAVPSFLCEDAPQRH